MMQLPTGAWNFSFEPMVPWLEHFQRLPHLAFKRLRLLMIQIDGNVDLLLSSQEPAEDEDDPMGSSDLPLESVEPLTSIGEPIIVEDQRVSL
jgi:hypothetical protein